MSFLFCVRVHRQFYVWTPSKDNHSQQLKVTKMMPSANMIAISEWGTFTYCHHIDSMHYYGPNNQGQKFKLYHRDPIRKPKKAKVLLLAK